MDYRDKDEQDNEPNNEDFDPSEVVMTLLERAQSDPHRKFEFIINKNEWRKQLSYYFTAKKVARGFNKMAKNLYKAYVYTVQDGANELVLLVTFKGVQQAAEYYAVEAEISKDMLSEYRSYVLAGNLVNFILGKERPEEECIDFRGIPHESDERKPN